MGERRRKLEETAVWMCIQIIEKIRRVSNRNQRYKRNYFLWRKEFSGGSDGKTSAYSVGDPGSIPGSGRSPGEGNGNPLEYSCLKNPTDRGAWHNSPWGCKELDMTERLSVHTTACAHTHTRTHTHTHTHAPRECLTVSHAAQQDSVRPQCGLIWRSSTISLKVIVLDSGWIPLPKPDVRGCLHAHSNRHQKVTITHPTWNPSLQASLPGPFSLCALGAL